MVVGVEAARLVLLKGAAMESIGPTLGDDVDVAGQGVGDLSAEKMFFETSTPCTASTLMPLTKL